MLSQSLGKPTVLISAQGIYTVLDPLKAGLVSWLCDSKWGWQQWLSVGTALPPPDFWLSSHQGERCSWHSMHRTGFCLNYHKAQWRMLSVLNPLNVHDSAILSVSRTKAEKPSLANGTLIASRLNLFSCKVRKTVANMGFKLMNITPRTGARTWPWERMCDKNMMVCLVPFTRQVSFIQMSHLQNSTQLPKYGLYFR